MDHEDEPIVYRITPKGALVHVLMELFPWLAFDDAAERADAIELSLAKAGMSIFHVDDINFGECA